MKNYGRLVGRNYTEFPYEENNITTCICTGTSTSSIKNRMCLVLNQDGGKFENASMCICIFTNSDKVSRIMEGRKSCFEEV